MYLHTVLIFLVTADLTAFCLLRRENLQNSLSLVKSEPILTWVLPFYLSQNYLGIYRTELQFLMKTIYVLTDWCKSGIYFLQTPIIKKILLFFNCYSTFWGCTYQRSFCDKLSYVSMSLQCNVVDLCYFKLWNMLDQIIKFGISKFYTIRLQRNRD